MKNTLICTDSAGVKFTNNELSLDPAVRTSPYAKSPKNEVVMPTAKKIGIRVRRIIFLIFHLLALLGLYYCVTGQAKLLTIVLALVLGTMALTGVGAGAHRLYSHRSYKATWQMRLILIIFQTLSGQYSCYNWARDHRLHHKYSDTDIDPHNANRGFFFSHIGWILIKRNPATNEKLKSIPMKDVEEDKIAMFQENYYVPMALILSYIIPTIIPWYFWSENFWISHVIATHTRIVLTLHCTFLINSVAHLWGMKPYDRNIKPTENMFVSAASFGDGWHNYHHTFPWDYRNSEFWDYKLNISTAFIDLCALIGWAYDLKTVSPEVVARRVKRTGDGSRVIRRWDDINMTEEDRKLAEIIRRSSRGSIPTKMAEQSRKKSEIKRTSIPFSEIRENLHHR